MSKIYTGLISSRHDTAIKLYLHRNCCCAVSQLLSAFWFQMVLDVTEKLQVQQRENQLTESCLNQIRGQLLDQERKRGKVFGPDTGSSAVSVIDQDIQSLVRSIDVCLQELDLSVEVKKEKIKEVSIVVSYLQIPRPVCHG